jgi:hypothetical protein
MPEPAKVLAVTVLALLACPSGLGKDFWTYAVEILCRDASHIV